MNQLADESSVVDAAKYFINLQDKRGKTATYLAAEFGHVDMVDSYLTRGADPMVRTYEGWTILHAAVQMAKKDADASMVETILSHGKVKPYKQELLDATDEQGRTAIHIASYKDVDAVTNALLVHGMNPLAKDAHGNDAVKLATRAGRRKSRELLEEFIKRDADKTAP
uniref:Ankyrin repeat domain-containing protein n=1 Tax=Prymnesium polylepis TaxID=72548 RepID=A0A7S4MXC6_9EUKA